jgi:hypothetical protein
MEKLREKLASRGARGIIGLGKAFRVIIISYYNRFATMIDLTTLICMNLKKPLIAIE